MSVQKNFVVKNGLEVNTNLIFADTTINSVGIATTIADYTLHVNGGIGATDLYVSGVATAGAFYGDGSNLTFSGPLSLTGLVVSGVSTLGVTTATDVTLQNLYVSGIGTIFNSSITNLTGTSGTITTLNVTNGFVTNLTGTSGTITDLNVTNGSVTNLTGTIGTIGSVQISSGIITASSGIVTYYGDGSNLTGIATVGGGTTLGITTITQLNVTGVTSLTSLTVSGISTFGNIVLNPVGIITASSGIVTYYGDGQYLQNILSGVGVATESGLVGTGATILDFRGAGISTVTVASGIATINITGGGGGGGGAIGIGSTFPGTPASLDPAPSGGDLFFHIDYGRTFIYYDEVELGIGATAVWVDSAPFNQGGLYVNKYGDNMFAGLGVTVGTLTNPSIYFNGYTNSGFYSPSANEFGVVVSGTERLNVNAGGVNVTGVVTATSFSGDGSELTGVGIGTDGSVNTSGIITASAFVGDGSGLTNLPSSEFSDGFIPEDEKLISIDTTLNNSQSNISFAEDLVIGAGVTFTVSTGTTVRMDALGVIDSSSITSNVVAVTEDLDIPNGTTSQRVSTPVAGSFRYNNQYEMLEVYTGSQWLQVVASSIIGRGVFGGASNPNSNTIDYITISTTGNASDFGDLTGIRRSLSACSSSTRGVFGGGYSTTNVIDYITISTIGIVADFGDLTVARGFLAACSSSTRGVFGGGATPSNVNTIDYITIATTGNATDFGDLTGIRKSLSACSSSTRGVFGGGLTPGNTNVIDYITIATTGNATDFGDLTITKNLLAACSSSTRGVFGGGNDGPSNSNVIDYITIATTGNATDFGDLTQSRTSLGACSSSTRGVFGGGYGPSPTNTMDYITIATVGNATDFGDLTVSRAQLSACSNSHGGLS